MCPLSKEQVICDIGVSYFMVVSWSHIIQCRTLIADLLLRKIIFHLTHLHLECTNSLSPENNLSKRGTVYHVDIAAVRFMHTLRTPVVRIYLIAHHYLDIDP